MIYRKRGKGVGPLLYGISVVGNPKGNGKIRTHSYTPLIYWRGGGGGGV